eukprot:Skav201639  [mRNA]  locus=scaffold3087:59938:64916:- [translate_table: standard]
MVLRESGRSRTDRCGGASTDAGESFGSWSRLAQSESSSKDASKALKLCGEPTCPGLASARREAARCSARPTSSQAGM